MGNICGVCVLQRSLAMLNEQNLQLKTGSESEHSMHSIANTVWSILAC